METIKISLIGDSLIRRANNEYELSTKIQNLLPQNKLEISVFAENGAMIKSIHETQLPAALATIPDIVILCWDSDCSDVDEKKMSIYEVGQLRQSYVETLKQVVEEVQLKGVYLAVAGPCILGEGFLLKPKKFWFKNPVLNAYRDINRDVCKTREVYYMDIRQAFIDTIPCCWCPNAFYLTVDGEHFNNRGTQIEANLFADAIKNFIDLRNGVWRET